MTTLKLDARAATLADLLQAAFAGAARLGCALRRHREAARTAALVDGLTAAQCRDMGIEAAAWVPARPVITVERGLMARLDSMR